MSEEWISVLVTWLPFAALLIVLLWVNRWQGMRSRGPSGRTLIEIYEQQIEETRRMNAILERMAVALEKRAASPRD
jgi:hypothetical protein